MAPPIKDLSNIRFGRLVVQSPNGRGSNGGVLWECLCDCGNLTIVAGGDLRKKPPMNTTSCGCFARERSKDRNTTHGASRTPEFAAWANMIDRCHNPRNHAYARYGGRGVTVCDEWIDSFETFIKDMGWRPSSDLSLDRINNNKGYSASNCRWATRSQQAQNREPRKDGLFCKNS